MACTSQRFAVSVILIAVLFAGFFTGAGAADPPVASFTATVDGMTAVFDASGSYDPDGVITDYTWSFGDGVNGNGEVVTHTYEREGNFTVTLTVKDEGMLTNQTDREIIVDVTPPTTEAALFPGVPNGRDGWYVSAVTVEFTAYDNGSGVDHVSYRLNKSTWHEYAEPLAISRGGTYNVSFYAVDAYGNREAMQSLDVNIDVAPPATECYTSRAPRNGWYDGTVYVSLEAFDNMSGMQTLRYRENGGRYQHYADDLVFPEGVHVLEYFAADNAGLAEPQQTRFLHVDATAPTVSIHPSDGVYLFERRVVSASFTAVVGNIDVEVTGDDALSGIARVDFLCDGVVRGNDTTEPYIWSWQDFSFGWHTLKVVACDRAGNEAQASERVFLINFKIDP
jgi:PKD repeat protein